MDIAQTNGKYNFLGLISAKEIYRYREKYRYRLGKDIGIGKNIGFEKISKSVLAQPISV
jgi:hypothetical protein